MLPFPNQVLNQILVILFVVGEVICLVNPDNERYILSTQDWNENYSAINLIIFFHI